MAHDWPLILILVCAQGTWKLGGFGFALALAPNEAGPNASTVCPYYVNPMARKVRQGSWRFVC